MLLRKRATKNSKKNFWGKNPPFWKRGPIVKKNFWYFYSKKGKKKYIYVFFQIFIIYGKVMYYMW